jgi:PAS domain S-box-containing protein
MLTEKVYKKAFQKSHEILILANCDYQVIEANEAAEMNFGYSKEEFKKLSLPCLFFHEKEGDQFTLEICKHNNVINWEYVLKAKSGKPISALVNGDKIDDASGTYLLVARNVAEINKETQAVIKKNQLLATKNMIRLFVHEMKNLSNSISLAAHELKENLEKKSMSASDCLNFIQENNQKMGELINSLLNIDKGITLDYDFLDINELLKETIQNNSEKLKLMDIQLISDLAVEKFFYPIDKIKFQMVLNNIIQNAIESISKGNGIISISSKVANQKAVVKISDNGSGIRKDDTENLFNPYFTTKEKGNGLGLSITKQVLFGHQIGFHLESEKNSGCTFSLYFDKKNTDLNQSAYQFKPL